MNVEAWIYARKSPSDTDEQLGVDSQKKLCLGEIGRREWHHAGTIEDVAKSAYEAQFRPGYERLLELIRAGQVGAVVVRHNDRLHRDVAEYKAFTKLVQKHKVQVVAVIGGEWTIDTAAGQFTGTMLTAMAEFESKLKSERVLAGALLRRAEAGLPAHTRFRPFGFEADGVTVRESEAELIRAGVADLIAGRRSMTAVAKSWGKTTTGARRILQSRRIIGQREYPRPKKGGPPGAVYKAVWPALIDRADWEVVQLILAGKTRPAYPRRHLLSGLARCGSCEALLKVGTVRGALTYRCLDRSDGAGQPACPRRVQRQADRLEYHVFIETMRHLARTKRDPFAAADAGEAAAEIVRLEKRRAEIEVQMSALDDASEEDAETVAMLTRSHRRIVGKIAEARGRITLTPVVGHEVAPGLTRPAWMQWWHDATPAEQRALLAEEIEAVYVHPTRHGNLPLDTDAVKIAWRKRRP